MTTDTVNEAVRLADPRRTMQKAARSAATRKGLTIMSKVFWIIVQTTFWLAAALASAKYFGADPKNPAVVALAFAIAVGIALWVNLGRTDAAQS